MGKKVAEHEKHTAGGPGKAARKGHTEPEKSGNKATQRQAGKAGLPGEGRGADPKGTARREPGKREKRPG